MKIIILGSIKNKANYKDVLLKIISVLEKDNHDVIHKHVTDNNQSDLN